MKSAYDRPNGYNHISLVGVNLKSVKRRKYWDEETTGTVVGSIAFFFWVLVMGFLWMGGYIG